MNFDKLVQTILEGTESIEQIAQRFCEEFLSKYQTNHVGSHNCAWATQQFILWARKNNIPAQSIYLVWPEKETVKELKQKGILGQHTSDDGESHIAPVVNGTIIDFTYKQFDNSFNGCAKITRASNWKSVYGRYGYGINTVEVNGKPESVLIDDFDKLKNMEEIGGISTIFPSKLKKNI